MRYIDAKREIQKQTGGVLMDLDQNVQSVAARPRRPGILRSDQFFAVINFLLYYFFVIFYLSVFIYVYNIA